MQYSIATSISTILMASALTSAMVLPRQAASTDVTVQFKNGDGDASVQQAFTAGSLVTTSSAGSAITSAVNAQIVSAGSKCQFFSDAKGTTRLGGVLTSGDANPVAFTDASGGSTASVATDAVSIGSVCCSSIAQFDAQCGSFGAAAPQSASQPANTPSGQSEAFSVRIQISGLSELATQGEILADGQPQSLEKTGLIGETALTASIVHTHKAVECQAADANGNALGGPFQVGKDADFGNANGVTVATVTCTQL